MFDEVLSIVNDCFAIVLYIGFKFYSGLLISNFLDYFDFGYSVFIGFDYYFVVCLDCFG